jgi:hypothetical protein
MKGQVPEGEAPRKALLQARAGCGGHIVIPQMTLLLALFLKQNNNVYDWHNADSHLAHDRFLFLE